MVGKSKPVEEEGLKTVVGAREWMAQTERASKSSSQSRPTKPASTTDSSEQPRTAWSLCFVCLCSGNLSMVIHLFIHSFIEWMIHSATLWKGPHVILRSALGLNISFFSFFFNCFMFNFSNQMMLVFLFSAFCVLCSVLFCSGSELLAKKATDELQFVECSNLAIELRFASTEVLRKPR